MGRGAEAGCYLVLDALGDVWVTAGEDVYGGVVVFWPRVGCDVAFGDDDNTRESVGAELVKDGFDDSGPCFFGGCCEYVF